MPTINKVTTPSQTDPYMMFRGKFREDEDDGNSWVGYTLLWLVGVILYGSGGWWNCYQGLRSINYFSTFCLKYH